MIRLKNSIGMVKECPQGFSWTTLFFGLFVPLLRGDLKNALIMGIVGLLTCGISWLVFPVFYNKTYINSLLMQGFTGATEVDKDILVSKGFIIRETKEEVKAAAAEEPKKEEVKVIEEPKIEAEIVEEVKNDNQ
jgi:hypothetical protein